MVMKRIYCWLCIGLFLLIGGANIRADVISSAFQFSPDDISFKEIDGFTQLTLNKGLDPATTPGHPQLPARFINILLPEHSAFSSLQVEQTVNELCSGIAVIPAQTPHSFSEPLPPFVGPDAIAYEQNSLLPEQWACVVGEHEMRGRTVVTIQLNPVRYNPAQQTAYLASEIRLNVNYTPQRTASATSLSPLFADMLNASVINPETIKRAPQTTNRISYLIITPAALTNTFAQLSTHRETQFGSGNTDVVALEDILSNFPGRDDPDKIRNFITEAVMYYQTDYVVLGGDDTLVPVRFCSVGDGYKSITNMPTDLYYSGLFGSWDANANQVYGEVEDMVDMSPDVIVSRIPVRTAEDASRYITKLLDYEQGRHSELYSKLLISGTKGFNMLYGADRGTDAVFDSYAQFMAHQPVSDVEQWNRQLHRDAIQPYWSAGTLSIFFDTLTTWDTEQAGDFQQTAERMVNVYDQGWEHQYFLTHGAWCGYGIEEVDGNDMFWNANAAQLTNLTCFIASPTCQTAHFDGPNDPCLAEVYLRSEAGALIYHACARNGKAGNEGYGGPSPVYSKVYYEHLFNGSASSFGEAYALGKADFIGVSTENNAWRWVQFGLNMLGDAAIPIRANTLPAAPVLTSAVTTNAPALGIALKWMDYATNATGFDIQRQFDTNDWTIVATSSITSYTDTAVSNAQFYQYRVRSTNATGASIWSDPGGLVVGTLPADRWDPADNTYAGATRVTNMTEVYTSQDGHTLSNADTNDWFVFNVTNGYCYWISTYSPDNVGGLFGQVYDEQMTLLASDGDRDGLGHFSFYLTPTNTQTYYLQVEPNNDHDSAAYDLFYKAAPDASGSEMLGLALNATQYVWSTSTTEGNPWIAQTNETYSDNLAVQSGRIYSPSNYADASSSCSWISAPIHADRGTLSFWMKSTMAAGTSLTIYSDDATLATITGSNDWQHYHYTLTKSCDTIEWQFAYTDPEHAWSSDVWMDSVAFVSENESPALAFKTTATNSLPPGCSMTYQLSTTQAGRIELAFIPFSGLTPTVYDDTGSPVQVNKIGNSLFWNTSPQDTFYVLLENNSTTAGTFTLTPLLSAHYIPLYLLLNAE
ncbi:MAG: hypothetical protein EOL87_03505 [Spartobacteria bacterium]|nr:hypothetical protein [Spartobacteria bacterium]